MQTLKDIKSPVRLPHNLSEDSRQQPIMSKSGSSGSNTEARSAPAETTAIFTGRLKLERVSLYIVYDGSIARLADWPDQAFTDLTPNFRGLML